MLADLEDPLLAILLVADDARAIRGKTRNIVGGEDLGDGFR